MFDHKNSPQMQRSHGDAAVRFEAGRLKGLRQRGSAKAQLPRVGAVPEVVFLNTSGGLTSGDTLSYALDIEGGRVVATTQAAERAYRADDGAATVRVTHRVGAGSWLDWVPQETILFDRSHIDRHTVIDLAPDAGCLMLEAVVLGRHAMGEIVGTLGLRDRREIRRAGRPVMIEPFVMGTAELGHRGALLGDARAFATMVMCCQGAEDAVSRVRDVLDEEGVEAAASGFDGKVIMRCIARDGWPLRKQLLRVMAVLRGNVPAPRVWQI
ncbi:urease accessory protein UreD [Thioclava sp. 'Guangxiensis']|uniref:urease accessory protein UreD n=1 Tax=Thioclava sp. 'Guangxiensis' TaxID=3149044 RepID=UPI0038783194